MGRKRRGPKKPEETGLEGDMAGMSVDAPGEQPRGAAGGPPRQPKPQEPVEDFPALGGGGPPARRAPEPVKPAPPPVQAAPSPGPAGDAPRGPARSEHQPTGKVGTITQLDIAQQKFSAQGLAPPKRPGYGTRGARKIQLNSNHFTIRVNLKGQIQHYDVKIELIEDAEKKQARKPGEVQRIPKGLTRRIMDLVGSENKSVFANIPVVYDGVANLYTPEPLRLTGKGGTTQTFIVKRTSDRDREESFSATLTWAAAIVLSDIDRYMRGDIADIPQNAVNAIDNVFRQNALSKSNMIGVGRSFFIQPTDPSRAYLGEGREIWMGYFQSARISNQKSLTLNVDITATTFYQEMNCAKFAIEFLRIRDNDTRPLKDGMVAKLRKEMRNLKCQYQYANIKKTRRITSITLRSAATLTFRLNETRQISVAKYFDEKYKIQLRMPFLPCIQFGRLDGQTFIPIELCTLLGGQRGQRKMTADQTSAMIRKTAIPPADRQNQIVQRVRESNFGNDPYTRAFGIDVNPSMVSLTGRVLQPPQMVYDGDKRSNPRAGAWDPKFLKFYKNTGSTIDNWGMVSFCDRTDGGRLHNFLEQMCKRANALGVDFTPAKYTEKLTINRAREFFEYAAKNGCKFLVCVLPGNNADMYARIKHLANIEFGIMTQCLKGNTVNKCNDMLLGNVLQKINAKLGGVNHVPHDEFLMRGVMGRPTIIFGGDVTHPAPGDKTRPSIAALVASMDRHACKYESRTAVQAHRKEIIVDLADMAKQLLMAFFRNTKMKPEKIIFFRDGVSEGQFSTVLNEELRALQRACTMLQPDYKPGITFVVVQKRHHTRFFPANPNDGEGKTRNVPAGTCVDQVVTHPTEYDYFLCSHAGIQGTSKPAHYHVLWDDSNLSPDDLQALSFYLCHCYSNCSRSVSIPAPVYYAHKVAALARVHLEPVFESEMAASRQSSDSGLSEPTDEMRKAIGPAACLPHMYFL